MAAARHDGELAFFLTIALDHGAWLGLKEAPSRLTAR
jgi:hypothetical protein